MTQNSYFKAQDSRSTTQAVAENPLCKGKGNDNLYIYKPKKGFRDSSEFLKKRTFYGTSTNCPLMYVFL